MGVGDPDGTEFALDRAGKGYLRYFGLAVDEPRAVGAHGITYEERMFRARDVRGNRQLLDWVFNSGTKGHFEERPISSQSPLPFVSVVDKPDEIWRPTLENVKEWRELADFIENKTRARVLRQTSPDKVKKIINDAIKDELKSPTTEAGRKLNQALRQLTGMDPKDLFRPRILGRVRWRDGQFRLSQNARQALMNGGVVLAGALVSYAESASAKTAEAQAKADLLAQSDAIDRHLTDNRDQGALILQVYEVRQMTAESAAITTFRYTTVTYGRKEHDAMWKQQTAAGLSKAIDVFSTEQREYIWVPPANERGPVTIPPAL